MNSKLFALALLFAASLTLTAQTFEVAAWRGETVAARVPDFATLGEAPAGFQMKVGAMKSVAYAPTPESLQRREVYDRVVWDASEKGPRVVEISVPPDAKPGVYACGMMNIRVVDRVLPPAKEWKYYLDLWQHPWSSARIARAEPFSAAHYAAMEPCWKLLASAGQKTLTVTLVDQPWNHQCYDGYGALVKYTRKADGTSFVDWSKFDEYVTFGKKCGLGPHIACYTMCPWGYLVSWYDEAGKMQKAKAVPGTAFFKEYWGPFLTSFAAHLKEKGWFDDTIISMDERTPEDLRNTVAFLHEKAPGLKIAMAGNRKPSDFNGIIIDSYSQIINHVDSDFLSEVPARQKDGKITTFYVCCWPHYPNTYMSSEAGEAFWLGAFPAMCGLDGFLRWAWNSWPNDPCADASYGEWDAGDTFLCYPNGQPSWRFLELRNGIIAAEKVRILKEQGLFKNELADLAAKFNVKEAIANKSPFMKIRAATTSLVNK